MRFLYPLGLLGLIAVPILIIIYIIKNKYVEQVVSSTYLWTLSEKFLKRRNPIRMITGIISLILQILAVIFISFAISHPVFTLPHAAEDFCFIIDGSGSMNITLQDGATRFDEAKERVRKLIADSATGSAYTLIVAGDSTDTLYQSIEDKERALSLLDEAEPSFGASGFVNAVSRAQEMFGFNPALSVYVVTDKSYEQTENVNVVNVSDGAKNYAVSDVEYSFAGGKLIVGGNVISYNGDAELDLNLYIDGAEECESTQKVAVKNLELTPFSFESDSVDFASLKVAVAQTDSLMNDNESVLYNVRYDRSFTTLVVSETPFFLQAVFKALGNARVDVAKPDKYENLTGKDGYGLYVFDGFSPAELPRNGAVWFVNPKSSVENSGFSMQSEISLSEPGKLAFSTSSSTRVKNLLAGLSKSDIYLSEYVKCGQYRNFINLISVEGSPVVFAGTNSFGNREVVFAFDFHNSDVPLSPDFPALMNNLIGYTFPAVVDNSSYFCGDSADINVLANCESVRVDTPQGKVVYLDTSNPVVSYTLDEAGVYTVTEIIGNTTRTVNLFATVPVSERYVTVSEPSLVISGQASSERRDGRYEDLLAFFIILAVLFIADWMVYCYEQYQLR